jgi:hypothetical protein
VIERLEFASCYSYSPRGREPLAAQSRMLRDALKRSDPTAFSLSAARVRRLFDGGQFRTTFGDDVTLVPVPGRAPLAPGATSRAQEICIALLDQRLAADVQSLLERERPVSKSAWAAAGERPDPDDHYASLGVTATLAAPRRIVLVDDFVTRGATLLGAASRLAERFPAVPLRAFAVVRTESFEPLRSIVDPREGVVERTPAGGAVRQP